MLHKTLQLVLLLAQGTALCSIHLGVADIVHVPLFVAMLQVIIFYFISDSANYLLRYDAGPR